MTEAKEGRQGLKANTTRHGHGRPFRLIRSFFPVLSAAILLASCNGNAGGSDYEGELYSPGTGSSSSRSDVDAADILDMSNAGDMEGIIARLTGGGSGGISTASPSTVVLKASDIGMPAGGTATLTITGNGVDYTATASADADGNVTFEIPAIAEGTEITASLTIKNPSGTALYAGSITQTVSGDNFQMDIRLTRQYWTLPASLTVTASPDGLVYDAATWDAESTTFNVSNLTGAPAGAVFSYEWEDADVPGTVISTDSALTKTVSDLLGGTVPSGDVSKSFTVTVTYTDESGASVSSSGSASVIVGGPVTLPSFTVSCTQPAGSRGSSSPYGLADLTSAFAFTPVPAAGTGFPAGTTFEWSITAGGGTPYIPADTAIGANCTAIPSTNLGLSESTIGRTAAAATTISVSCTARNSRATAPKSGSSSVGAYLLHSLPSFTISITPAASAYDSACSVKSGSTITAYALKNLTGSFTIKATPAAGSSFPPGTEFTWTVHGTTLTGASQKGASVSLSPSAMGLTSISSSKTSPTTISVSCTAKNDDAVVTSKDAASVSVKVFQLTLPDFKVTVQSVPSGVLSRTEGTGSTATTIYLPLDTDMTDTTKKFTFKAEPKTSGDSFPTGTTFTWSFLPSPQSVTTAGATFSGLTGSTTAPTSAQNIDVTCTATYGTLTKQADKATIKIQSPFDVHNLETYLASLPANDADHPYAISVTGMSLDRWGNNIEESSILNRALRNNPGKYVDLRGTTLPNGQKSMYSLFLACSSLVYAPEIPATVTDVNQTFKGCSSLKTPPDAIPSGVTDMNECFECCTSLTAAPEIPASVTIISGCFAGCGTSLTGNVVIHSTNLENAHGAFRSLDGNTPTNITAIYVRDDTVAGQLGTWNDGWIKTVGGTGIVQIGTP